MLCKSDHRVCPMSLETRRPTFRELIRIHKLLATVELTGKTNRWLGSSLFCADANASIAVWSVCHILAVCAVHGEAGLVIVL